MRSSATVAAARRVRFGDVVRLCTDRCADPTTENVERYVGLEHLEPEDLRIRRWGMVADGITFTNRFRAGQVLFGKRRAYQRKVAVADFDGVCSGDIYVFEAKKGELLPELLPYICSTDAFFEHAIQTSAGSLSPRTNWNSLAEWSFSLPSADAQAKYAKLLLATQSVCDCFKVAETVGTTTLNSLREALFEEDAEYLAPLSAGVVSSAYGPRFPATQYVREGRVRTIRTTDMPENGIITYATAPAADIPEQLTRDHCLQTGDFLISRTGFTSGRAAVFRDPEDGVTYVPAAFLVRLRMNQSILLPEYLLEFLQTRSGQRLIQSLQRGTQQLNISASALVRQNVPVPELQRQNATVEALQDARGRLRLVTERLEQAVRMRQAFSSEILLSEASA